MYENQTEELIKQRMLSKAPEGINTGEGDFFNDAVSPAAIEFAKAYIQMDKVLELAFADTSYGEYLDKIAAESGLERKAATKGSGLIEVTMAVGSVINSGDVLATWEGNIRFVSKETKTIGETGKELISFENETPGNLGTVLANTMFVTPVAITGFISATNPTKINAGTEEETDDALRERLMIKVKTPSTSGNANDYKLWALEVSGVGDAKVFPLWNGNGTVKVAILGTNMQPASSTVIDTVSAHIETKKPIGAAVSVVSASGKTVNVTAKVVLAPGYTLQSVNDNFTAALSNYLKSIAFKETYVSYAKVGTILLNVSGVLDYSGLYINSSSANVPLSVEETPVLGTVGLEV